MWAVCRFLCCAFTMKANVHIHSAQCCSPEMTAQWNTWFFRRNTHIHAMQHTPSLTCSRTALISLAGAETQRRNWCLWEWWGIWIHQWQLFAKCGWNSASSLALPASNASFFSIFFSLLHLLIHHQSGGAVACNPSPVDVLEYTCVYEDS